MIRMTLSLALIVIFLMAARPVFSRASGAVHREGSIGKNGLAFGRNELRRRPQYIYIILEDE
jgi:hypothetical protein